jgi:replicative DNA helicase
MTQRLFPASPDAEKALLGCMLIGGPDVIEDVAAALTVEHFHTPGHAVVFAAIIALHTAQKPVDLITLTQHLRDADELDIAGGPAGVTDLQVFMPTAANFAEYVRILREKNILRRIITVSTQFASRCYEEQDNTERLLEEFQGEAIDIGGLTADADSLKPISKQEVMDAVERLNARYHQKGTTSGLPTGLHDLDRMLDGLKPKYVYVFAGRPAMGKSAAGINIAENIALGVEAAASTLENDRRAAVAVFAVEMTREQIIDRLICGRARIDMGKLRTGFLAEQDFPKMSAAAWQILQGRIILDDTAGLTIAQFRARARRAVVLHKAKLIVIDYVQIMKGSSKRARDSRNLELAEIMQGIRETAKQLNVPIIVLAQLNRGAEDRKDSRPTMADLKECGAIEEEAHVVGLLYRPIYYAKSEEQRQKLLEKYQADQAAGVSTMDDLENYAEMIIDKQRDGATGTVRLNFFGSITRFESRTKKLFSNNPDERQR